MPTRAWCSLHAGQHPAGAYHTVVNYSMTLPICQLNKLLANEKILCSHNSYQVKDLNTHKSMALLEDWYKEKPALRVCCSFCHLSPDDSRLQTVFPECVHTGCLPHKAVPLRLGVGVGRLSFLWPLIILPLPAVLTATPSSFQWGQ